MIPAHRFAMATVSLTLSGLAWLSSSMPAQAATITDTLELLGSDKGWCRGNPRFFQAFTLKATDGVIVTITQDPLNTGDRTTIEATINTHGDSADLDAITMKGLAFPSNKSHSIAQLILFGTNPSNPDHFLTIRGQATFDKIGHLIRVTGTVLDQLTDTYTIDKHGTQSGPVDCFESGTFTAKQKPPASGGGDGTLTVTGPGAPASVGGTFVADGKLTRHGVSGNVATVTWTEAFHGPSVHAEILIVGFDITTNEIVEVIFSMADLTVSKAWNCTGVAISGLATCDGVTVNPTAGTVILANQVLGDNVNSNPTITLNGTLTFTPF